VLELSTDQLVSALGMTVTGCVSLFKVRRGEISAWKGLAVPFAAQSSVLIACLAAKGITGPQDAFAGDFGFWQQISGEFQVERLAPGVEPRTIFNTGYKHWPVEYDAQFAVWLAQQIRAEVSLHDIEHLSLYTSEWTWQTIANDPTKWAPATRETADHSLPYIVAVALTRGRIDHDDFDPEVLRTPEYVDLMARISVHADEAITAVSHERCAFRATVRTHSGEVREFELSEPRAKPMTDDELDTKWAMLTGKSRLVDGSAGLLADLRRLDGTQRVRDLMAPLVQSG
jgi:2-methylcitrate dehydratase